MTIQNAIKLSVVALIVGVGVVSLSTAETRAASASVAVSASPRSVYTQHCARCHGGDGRSDTKTGRETEADDISGSNVKNMSVEKMTRIIKNGKGEMPAFAKKMTAAQITQVIGYVRSL